MTCTFVDSIRGWTRKRAASHKSCFRAINRTGWTSRRTRRCRERERRGRSETGYYSYEPLWAPVPGNLAVMHLPRTHDLRPGLLSRGPLSRRDDNSRRFRRSRFAPRFFCFPVRLLSGAAGRGVEGRYMDLPWNCFPPFLEYFFLAN